MMNEIIHSLNGKIWHEISIGNGSRIVDLWPIDEKVWPSQHLANHNVFRLNARNEVVWQVRRVETPGQANWEMLNRQAKEDDPSAEGYLDPFWTLGLDETAALDPKEGLNKSTDHAVAR